MTVAAENVTIKNSLVAASAGDNFGILVRSGNAIISNTTVKGSKFGVVGDFAADHVEVTALKDDGFVVGSNTSIVNSWCHDLAPDNGNHVDCGQLRSGETNVLID
ncbi:MAG: hypothetical protein JWN95_507, partial [Frankiales bacterium]|nr:hypothetical protein [Frankiales bacterium]